MKNLDWTDVRWAVVKEDGAFAGAPWTWYLYHRNLYCGVFLETGNCNCTNLYHSPQSIFQFRDCKRD